MTLPKSIQNLIDSFEALPGIGPKTAQRLTFYLLRFPEAELDKFGNNLKPQNANKVTSNFTGGFHSDEVSEIREKLVNQISNTVQWRKNMQSLVANAAEIYEIGPGRPLRDFFKTIGVTCQSITGLVAAEKIFSGSN